MSTREPGLAVGTVIAVAFAAVAAFVVIWFPEREMRSARAALEHKAENQAQLVAYTIAPAIDFDDLAMVDEVLAGAARDTDFVSVSVLSEGGEVLRSRGETHTTEATVEVETDIASAGRRLGTLRLAMSEARIQEENRTQLVAASGIAFTILLLGLGVAAMVTQAVRRVASLTAQNANTMAAKERAEARSRFMSVLSHEVRTPLNGVLGIADALTRRPLDPESRSLAGALLRSGQNLLELINDVLDSAKLESGRVEVERTPFDPEAAALRVAEMLMALARTKGLELVVDVAEGVPRQILGDRHRVQQILTNLVGNALKFTETGHVRVKIGWRPEGLLEVSVSDTGIGIPVEKQAVVFEAFSQADASTTRRFGGTGLGLTISRDLVRLMGGELRLTSEVGRGTTFSFELKAPVVTEDAQAAAVSALRPEASELWVMARDGWAEVIERRSADLGITTRRIDDEAAVLALAALDAEIVVVRDAALGAPSSELERALRDASRRGRARVVGLASALDTAVLGHLADAMLGKPFAREDFARALTEQTSDATERDSRPDIALKADARVLIADDDRVNRLVMKVLFDGLGGLIELVVDGREVVERTARDPVVDLLLVDGEMPEVDGFEAVRRIREREASTGAPRMVVLMVSAHARELLWPRARAVGADGYLAKPVTLEALSVLLREHAGALIERPSARAPRAGTDGDAALRAAFDESTSSSIAALSETIRAKDFGGGARHAHKLKGTCLVYGAATVAEAAAALEKALQAGVEADVMEHMFAVEIALQEHAHARS